MRSYSSTSSVPPGNVVWIFRRPPATTDVDRPPPLSMPRPPLLRLLSDSSAPSEVSRRVFWGGGGRGRGISLTPRHLLLRPSASTTFFRSSRFFFLRFYWLSLFPPSSQRGRDLAKCGVCRSSSELASPRLSGPAPVISIKSDGLRFSRLQYPLLDIPMDMKLGRRALRSSPQKNAKVGQGSPPAG